MSHAQSSHPRVRRSVVASVATSLALLAATVGPAAGQVEEDPGTTTTTTPPETTTTTTTAPPTSTTTTTLVEGTTTTTVPPGPGGEEPVVELPPGTPPLAPPQRAVLEQLLADHELHSDDELDFLTRLLGTQSLLHNLELEMANLDVSLAALDAEVAVAQQHLDLSNRALQAILNEQSTIDDDLAAAESLLRSWAVEAYMRGGSGPGVSAVLKATDPAQLGATRTYADTVTVDQKRAMEAVRRLRADYDELEATRRGQQAEAQAARAEVGVRQLEVQQQRAQYDQARAAAQLAMAEEQGLLAETASRRAEYEQRLIDANLVSDGISARLAALQAGQETPLVTAGMFLHPLAGGRVSSLFGPRVHPIYGVGRMHNGIDFTAPTGTPIRAAHDGVVVIAGPQGGYGNTVVIDHGNGVGTLYAHLSAFTVREGQPVRRGDIVGAVGSTGLSTGPHLHFEVRREGQPVNPLPYLAPTG